MEATSNRCGDRLRDGGPELPDAAACRKRACGHLGRRRSAGGNVPGRDGCSERRGKRLKPSSPKTSLVECCQPWVVTDVSKVLGATGRLIFGQMLFDGHNHLPGEEQRPCLTR